jgi:hypothetical protein
MVAAAALLLAGCGSGSSHPGAEKNVHPETPAVTEIADPGFGCPGPGTSPDAIVATPDLTILPHGAKAAQICYLDNGLLWLAPAGRLTRGVRGLVSLVNSRQAHRPQKNEVCNADLGPAYAIVFRYPDGIRTITADTSGCREIVVGSTERAGGRSLFHSYLAALARQRAHTRPPARRVHLPGCIPDRIPPFSPVSDPAHLSDARLCPQRPGSAPAYVRHGRRLDTAQLAALRHDLASAGQRVFEPRPGRHYCRSPIVQGPLRITAVDRWGDQFVLDISCDIYRYETPHGSRFVMVHLLPATARLLARP